MEKAKGVFSALSAYSAVNLRVVNRLPACLTHSSRDETVSHD